MNLKDKYNGIRQEVKSLMDAHPDGMPQEVATKVTNLLEEADGLKGQIELADRAAGLEDYSQPAGAAARTTWQRSNDGEGDEFVDEQSWRETEYKVFNPIRGVETKTMRWFVPARIDNKEYKFAMQAYLARGEHGMSEREFKTLQEGTDNAGGYLVAPEMQERVLARVASMATIRNYATVLAPTRGDSVVFPSFAGDTDTYPGELRGTWAGENPASNAVRTNNTFGQVNIPVNTMLAEMLVSRNLLEDTGLDLAGWLGNKFGETFALQEDDAFLNGNGVSRPRGMLVDVDQTGGITSVATGASSTLTTNGIIDLESNLPPQYLSDAVWVMSQATTGAVGKLTDSAGTLVWANYNQPGGAFGGVPNNNFRGYPLLRDQFMPAVAANAYPIIFGSLQGYTVIDRVGISIQRLVEKYADQNYIGLLARKRVGGRLTEPYRLRVAQVST